MSLALAGCQSTGSDDSSDDTLSPAAEAPWTTLFDGTDLDHFDQLGEAQWNIVDDYVEADGYRFSYLVTRQSYSDFELEVDFWPSADANSGVYIRCQNPDEIGAESGYEINIYDTNDNLDGRTGSIIHFSPPLEPVVAGEQWNTYNIRAEGARIVVHLNGKRVNDLEDESYASGPIALQNNGGLIRFRNVRVKEL